jgi:hypothetical protein
VTHDPARSIVDSCPVPVCRRARARRCRRLREVAAAGKDHADHQTFSGLRAPIRIGWPGGVAAGGSGIAPTGGPRRLSACASAA